MYLSSALRRAVQVNGRGVATVDGSRVRTWTELADRVARLAGALRRLGLEPGDRVAMLAWNSDRYLEYYFAVPWAGGVIMPFNPRWSVPEIEFACADAGVRMLLADRAFHTHAARAAAGGTIIRHLIHADDLPAPDGWLDYDSLLVAAQPIANVESSPDAPLAIFYTGGTTGRAKGVTLSSANLHANALVAIHAFGLDTGTVYLHAPTLGHLADGTYAFAVTYAAGTHVFIPSFEPGRYLDAAARHRVTHLMLIPTLLKMLLDHPAFGATDLRAVTTLIYGATPIADAVLAEALARLPGVRFVQAYGQTELSPIATVLEPRYHALEGPWADKRRSCGQAVPGVEVQVVDGDGNELPRGMIGEIRARGANVMLGYWNRPEETAATLRDGWVWTGDAGRMDDDGFVYVVDRLKDMIKTGGENVYSAEVENALMSFPGVAACAVIAIPHDTWGEAVHAVVVPSAGVTLNAEALIAHCRDLIAGYKTPRSIEIRPTPLPLTPAGKVLKRELREPYWRARQRQVN